MQFIGSTGSEQGQEHKDGVKRRKLWLRRWSGWLEHSGIWKKFGREGLKKMEEDEKLGHRAHAAREKERWHRWAERAKAEFTKGVRGRKVHGIKI